MRRIGISFVFYRSFKGIGRSFLMSLTALLLVSCLLLVLGSYSLLHLNLLENTTGISGKGQAVIFLQEDCTMEDTTQIAEVLNGHLRTGLIKEYVYVSAMDALQSELDRFADYPQLYQSFQTGDNPYRASFVVTAANEASFEAMLTALKELTITRMNDAEEVVAYEPVASLVSHHEAVKQAESVLTAVRNAVLIFEVFLLLVCLFVLTNTVRLSIFSQRKEISVMRYLGATHGFLTAPFICQGLLTGFLSAGLAFFAQWLVYQTISDFLLAQYQWIELLSFNGLWYYLLAAFLAVGLIVGWFSGWMAVSRYLPDQD